jgi:hypothetical protein
MQIGERPLMPGKSNRRPSLGRFLLPGAVFVIFLAYFGWRLPPVPRFTLGNESGVRLLNVAPDGTLVAVAATGQIQLRRIADG